MKFFYVYILQSINFPDRHYTGFTEDLLSRLEKHNSGQCPHTSKFKPWKINTAISFDSKEKAMDFEKYLKSHSGRAFAKKHFEQPAGKPLKVRNRPLLKLLN